MNTHQASKSAVRWMSVFWAVFLLAISLAVDLAAGQSSRLSLAYYNYLPIIYKPAVIYVDADAIGNNDGSSWADAYTTLQAAFENATAGSQVWVAAGTYYPSVEACGSGSDRYRTFQLKNGVAVYGGFDPSIGDVSWGDRDWVANAVILSGDIGILGDKSDNSYHVFCHPFGFSLDSSAILDGFVIQDGNANDADFVEVFGGGMNNSDISSPTLRNITFSNNSAVVGGGLSTHGATTLTNITFINNFASQDGGGMNGGYQTILTNVTFSHNSAVGFGGGLYGDPVLDNVTFYGNSASFGGGMYNTGSTTLTNVIFLNNSASWDGGGIFNYANGSMLVNVTFSGNTAVYGGGGMYNASGRAKLVNIIFYNNTAVVGGGIFNSFTSPTLVNVTFYGNMAVNGGGIYDTNSETMITNCILWGDAAEEIFNDNSNLVVTYSDVRGGYSGEGNVDADPRFIDAPGGNLGLQGTSPAIDAGNNAAPGLVGISTDLDGNPRFVDIPAIPDTGIGIAPIVDMGANEAQP
jgi:predicted outer membrane repeat protein